MKAQSSLSQSVSHLTLTMPSLYLSSIFVLDDVRPYPVTGLICIFVFTPHTFLSSRLTSENRDIFKNKNAVGAELLVIEAIVNCMTLVRLQCS